ncbi:hypothetical protein V1505DRAFT_21256 [Lipomyces doorenjongii]
MYSFPGKPSRFSRFPARHHDLQRWRHTGELQYLFHRPRGRPDVIVNLVDPGLCRVAHRCQRRRGRLPLTGRKPQDEVWTYVDAAVVKGKESHGCFCMDWEIHPFTKLVYLPEGRLIMDAHWEETMVEFEFAGVREILKKCKEILPNFP